jgi:hypothetical protein
MTIIHEHQCLQPRRSFISRLAAASIWWTNGVVAGRRLMVEVGGRFFFGGVPGDFRLEN